MDVIPLAANCPPDRFYRGGRRITDFRREQPAGAREPEDWIASTTALAGTESLGVTVLPDGRLLSAAVAEQPEAWLGPAHLARFGPDTRLLVKLLDAGQRLPVHAHPHVSFAHRHLGRSHGKAEAWFIVHGGEVHLGLAQDIAADRLRSLVSSQDTSTLLGLLHRIDLRPGDVVYVPPGVLHAIGAGVFLVELQEPEDLSILLEWRGFALDGAGNGHLGLGFDLALEAVERGRSDPDVRPAGFGPSVLPSAGEAYFRLERVALDGETSLDPGFAVLVVLSGEASLRNGGGLRLRAGVRLSPCTRRGVWCCAGGVRSWHADHPARPEWTSRGAVSSVRADSGRKAAVSSRVYRSKIGFEDLTWGSVRCCSLLRRL